MPSFRYAVALVGVAISGLALSIYLTTDSRWMQSHLSRLGEGGHLSSAIFNFTMGLVAVLLAVTATRLTDELERSHRHPRQRYIHVLFLVAAVMCTGVACFPFDTYPSIHNVFGHLSALALVLCMIGLSWLYPYFPRRVYYLGVLSALFVTLEAFTRRTMLMKKLKSSMTLDLARNVMGEAKAAGAETNFLYIAGLDPLPDMEREFPTFADVLTRAPQIQTFQAYIPNQLILRDCEAGSMDYFLKTRGIVEQAYPNLPPTPAHNFRSLWFTAYRGIELADTANTIETK